MSLKIKTLLVGAGTLALTACGPGGADKFNSEAGAFLDEGGFGSIDATEEAEAAWGDQITADAQRTLFVRTNSWYTGANVPGKPRQFLAHLRGSQYFEHIDEVAANGFEGFAFVERR